METRRATEHEILLVRNACYVMGQADVCDGYKYTRVGTVDSDDVLPLACVFGYRALTAISTLSPPSLPEDTPVASHF